MIIKILFTILEVSTIAIPLLLAVMFLFRRADSYNEKYESSKVKFMGFSRGQYRITFRVLGVICLLVSAFATWQFYFSDEDAKVFSESKEFWNEIENDPDANIFIRNRGVELLKKEKESSESELRNLVPESNKSSKLDADKTGESQGFPLSLALLSAAIAIPARMGSTRFPGKPLALLAGKEVLRRVHERCLESKLAEKVVILTDSPEICEFSDRIKAECIMTSPKCNSGTERILEAFDKIGADFIVNVQGDEPFIPAELVDSIISERLDNRAELVTAAEKITDAQALINPNVVKILRDAEGKSMYFSRSPLPYVRGEANFEKWLEKYSYWRHIGIYGYSAKALAKYATLPQTPLENAEMLEQLRFISAGYKFDIVETSYASIGIDTPADLAAAEEFLANANLK